MLTWSDIQNITTDSQLYLQDESKQNGRTYWFWYFFSEALEGAKDKADHRDIMVAVTNKYFEKQTGAPTATDKRRAKLKKDSTGRAALLESITASELRTDLTKLLLIGFKCVGGDPAEIWKLKRLYGTYREKQRDDSKVKATHQEKGYLKVIAKNAPVVVWRTAQVPLSEIQRDVEIRAKADITDKATARNITADFNPFGDAKIRSFYWFRKKSTDNDCQALASVGNTDEWKNVAAFPLLNSYSKKYEIKATCTRGSETAEFDFIGADVTMVLFLLHGTVLDTNEVQRHYQKTGFPEYGIKGIDQNQVYGAINFTRVHHGPGKTDDSTGFTIFYKNHWIQYDSWDKARGSFTDYENIYNTVKRNFDDALVGVKTKKQIGWAMDGYQESQCVINIPGGTPPTKIYKVASYVTK